MPQSYLSALPLAAPCRYQFMGGRGQDKDRLSRMAIGENEKQKRLATSGEKSFLMGKGVFVLFCFAT